MKVLSLQNSMPLVTWIKKIAELSTNREMVNNQKDAYNTVKAFLVEVLKCCKEVNVEDNSSEESSPVSHLIGNILIDLTLSTSSSSAAVPIRFERQTTEHLEALIGTYFELVTENYKKRCDFINIISLFHLFF